MIRLIPLLLMPFLAAATDSAPDRLVLTPPGTVVRFRAYGLGLFPLNGNFTRFDGVMTYHHDARTVCRVTLRVEVASLAMFDPSVRDEILGPEFMDAVHFPTLEFSGTCQSGGLAGTLAMHGVSRPLVLDLTWDDGAVTAEGQMRRAEWGMTAKPFLGGSTVRIAVEATLPAAGVSR
jgi:polyisoprenoid-binding protein YceI